MPAENSPDFAAIKTRQQAAWATGNYAVVGAAAQIVPERLCEAMDIRAGWKVLDVAAGSGNASLAAARCWCEVTSTDFVPALLQVGRARAAAEGFAIKFAEADAEDLPFGDGEFDAVVRLEIFRTYYGPMNRTFAALDEAGHGALTADLIDLVGTLNRANDGTMVLASEYLEAVIVR